MINKDINCRVAMYAACSCANEEGIWFVHGRLPVLFFFNFEHKKITLYKVIPNCKNQQIAMFSTMYETSSKVFLIPNNEKKIVIYSKNDDRFIFIELENACDNMFRGCFLHHGYLYCFPYRYDKIVKIDIESLELVYSESWKTLFNLKADLYTNSVTELKGGYAGVIPENNDIIFFNVDKERWEKIPIGKGCERYTQICATDKFIYLVDVNDRKLVKADVNSMEIKDCIKLKFESTCLKKGFGDDIIVDYVYSKECIVLNDNLEIIAEIDYQKEKINREFASCFNYGCWCDGNEGNLLCIDTENHLLIINRKYKILSEPIDLDYESWKDIGSINSRLNKVDVNYENSIYGIGGLLKELLV